METLQRRSAASTNVIVQFVPMSPLVRTRQPHPFGLVEAVEQRFSLQVSAVFQIIGVLLYVFQLTCHHPVNRITSQCILYG